MEIGAIITARRTELGMTLEELGEKVGVTKSTVKKWESGFIKNMGRDKIQLLSKALNLSPITFITGEIHPLTNIEPLDSNKFYNIPLYNSVSAGFGALAVDSIIDYVPLYFDSFAEANETLCISVTGDSMFPKIEHGDIIQVRKQSSVDSGSVAVVLVDGVDGLVKKSFTAMIGLNYRALIQCIRRRDLRVVKFSVFPL